MIYRIGYIIGGWGRVSAGLPDGRYVCAIPEQFCGGLIDRLNDAVAVFLGRAVALKWPELGEIDEALTDQHRTKGKAST